ncbi:molybdopterin-dependent oxidoreductase [Anaerobacillus sp. MEB173]|uniref:molybdopterin-containing oxidoreductase family protein n=1 Tax=Anaerobacillus sp. MEB173 TaxID=3383345 RepID=UPI003F913C04
MVKRRKKIPTMCINCSTVCGVIANVENGKVVKIEGNQHDPNSRGFICAKGHAAINMLYDPNRILYPLKRIGRRGEGKWRKISWDEALDEVSSRLKPLLEQNQPEKLAFQYGRDCTNGLIDRFTNAFGTPNKIGHRGLCSLNKRMAIKAAVGDADWDTNDVTNTSYMLNFGSNFYEAHQGHIPFLNRVAAARKRGAKLVTFDVRLSNTAAKSDEWIPVFPGTDGLIALSIGHVLMEEGLHDAEFLDKWTTFPSEKLKAHLRKYTPETAEQESGVPAATIRRIAREFAQSAPQCTTISNRGSHAHTNGFYNESAIILLNAIVGSVGKKGGWCYLHEKFDQTIVREPKPVPPKVEMKTELSHPFYFSYANELYPRAISSTLYPAIASGKVNIDVLITYFVNAPMSWPEGPTDVHSVYLDEKKIPFHVAIDSFYSESAHLADIILPDTTFLERWDLDARNSYELTPYVGLRQPVVKPLGDVREIRMILRDIAHKVGFGMERYFNYETPIEFMKEWTKHIPGGLERLQETGFYWDQEKEMPYEPYKKPLSSELMKNGHIDKDTGVITVAEKPVGVYIDGIAYEGFQTQSRKFQIFNPRIEQLNKETMKRYSPLPIYKKAVQRELKENECVLTTFKWNVHTQSRTMNQKWLAELVHDNPVWINRKTAAQLKINKGDQIEISNELGKIVVSAHVTEGIHPKVIAISASFGHREYGKTASGKKSPISGEASIKDNDLELNKWWKSTGVNPNSLIASLADPIGGGQAWNDTIVTVKRVRDSADE